MMLSLNLGLSDLTLSWKRAVCSKGVQFYSDFEVPAYMR